MKPTAKSIWSPRHIWQQWSDIPPQNKERNLGVHHLDRSLTCKRNIEIVRNKLKSRVHVTRKLTGTTRGCSAKTLRTTPVWIRSTHVKMIDVQIHLALPIIMGAVYSTPIPWKIQLNLDLPINDDIYTAPSTPRLKSRKSFWNFYRNFERMKNLRTLRKRWRNESDLAINFIKNQASAV